MNASALATKSSTPKIARTHRHADGTIHALSSTGATCYTVTLGTKPSCTCFAGQRGRCCYHVSTAALRYGNAAFFAPVAAAWRAVDRTIGDVSDLYQN